LLDSEFNHRVELCYSCNIGGAQVKNKKRIKSPKSLTTFRQSEEGQQLLDQMADQENMDRSMFVRHLIHNEAFRRGLEIPEVVKREST